MVAKRALSTVATVVVLLTATACTSLQGTKPGTTVVTQDGGFAQIKPDDRGEPVALDGEDLQGKPVSLDTMRGKPTVVNVWGSWCGALSEGGPTPRRRGQDARRQGALPRHRLARRRDGGREDLRDPQRHHLALPVLTRR